jgi:hypothetical protein
MDATGKASLTEAEALYRAGKFAEAERVYQRLRQDTSNNAHILTRLGELTLWQNQTDAASEYLRAAQQQASWIGKRWLLNIQRKSALAMTYYRQDRFPQAAQAFHEAAGPLAIGPLRDLKAMGDQLALFGTETPYRIEGTESVTIPFTQTDPLPLIQVSVNGSEPLPFFIDTGGAEVILDNALADQIGVARSGTLSGEGGGTKGQIGLGKLASLTLGDLSVHHLPVHFMDTSPFAAVFDGLPVKGVIGNRLLMHFLATIDYRNDCLILRPKSFPFPLTPTMKVIPFWLIQSHYIVTVGALNDQESMLFFIDTGLAGKGVSALESEYQKAGVSVDWSKVEKGVAAFSESETVDITVNRVTLGNGEKQVIAQDVPGVAFKKPFAVLGHTLGFYIGGVVSHQFFREYALTLDFDRMQLILS